MWFFTLPQLFVVLFYVTVCMSIERDWYFFETGKLITYLDYQFDPQSELKGNFEDPKKLMSFTEFGDSCVDYSTLIWAEWLVQFSPEMYFSTWTSKLKLVHWADLFIPLMKWLESSDLLESEVITTLENTRFHKPMKHQVLMTCSEKEIVRGNQDGDLIFSGKFLTESWKAIHFQWNDSWGPISDTTFMQANPMPSMFMTYVHPWISTNFERKYTISQGFDIADSNIGETISGFLDYLTLLNHLSRLKKDLLHFHFWEKVTKPYFVWEYRNIQLPQKLSDLVWSESTFKVVKTKSIKNWTMRMFDVDFDFVKDQQKVAWWTLVLVC